MKRSIPRISRGTDASSEIPALEAWEERVNNQFTQTLRNTGRIEQLEAKHADLEQQLKQIVDYLQSSEWTVPKLSWRMYPRSRRQIPVMPHVYFQLKEGLTLWSQAPPSKETLESPLEQLTLRCREQLSKITKLFAQLEKDFDEVPRRIARCALLEEELANFEDSLEDEEAEYLGWCVSLIRDVLDYNYAEDLTNGHLGLLKKAIDLICSKGLNCDKKDCESLHREFLEAGLALIPTSQKAIDKYGE